MKRITRLQNRVLAFICGYQEARNCPPSWMEIREGLGIKNKGTLSRVMDGLEAKGYIERKPGQHRNIIVLREYDSAVQTDS